MIMDQLRNLIWEINSMLAVRSWNTHVRVHPVRVHELGFSGTHKIDAGKSSEAQNWEKV